MNGHTYSPDLIAWVKRTTTTQGLPERIDPHTFTRRIGALFDLPTANFGDSPG